MSRKELEELLNHYRNLYQIVKRDKDQLERELEEYKTLSTMQQDIITSLNKRIENIKNNCEVLEKNSNMLLSNKDELKVTRIEIH